MIMVPGKATLSRIFTNSSHLLSRAWNKVALSSRRNPTRNGEAEALPLSAGLPREETELQSSVSGPAAADLPASLQELAEQMLGIVEIVSVQEQAIQVLKQRCQRLEDHDQAIMVAFTTFFHVLAAGHVAKTEDIAVILNNIIDIAEREDRPRDAIAFLKDLAGLLSNPSSGSVVDPDRSAPGVATGEG
ncbi:hypothetical protein [Microvirga subterranea]|uniref:Uncharacterized protein n=1 Tax=Microvirga subterranea TaxID=186651 RepID=A0A370HRL8_9HYPH|nr:hypothetical protein [Microvirga subterranea]RDI59574.1 hypothetical protein DES45_104494 [Microvirga subterranea]